MKLFLMAVTAVVSAGLSLVAPLSVMREVGAQIETQNWVSVEMPLQGYALRLPGDWTLPHDPKEYPEYQLQAVAPEFAAIFIMIHTKWGDPLVGLPEFAEQRIRGLTRTPGIDHRVSRGSIDLPGGPAEWFHLQSARPGSPCREVLYYVFAKDNRTYELRLDTYCDYEVHFGPLLDEIARSFRFIPIEARSEPAPVSPSQIFWERGYPQRTANGCIQYVAQWSDGTFTWALVGCPPGVTAHFGPIRAVRFYPQRAANGCMEYVTQWSRGDYAWVPFWCPPGVAYPKSMAGPLMPALTE